MSQTPTPNNVPGAGQGTAEGLAAPGCAGAGGTNSRNRNQWLSVASFLALQNLGLVLQARGADGGEGRDRSSAARAAQTLPVGNHGEIVAKGRTV